MMTQFVLARFAPHVGDAFAVGDAPGMSWTLAEVARRGAVDDVAAHGAFSLSFRGPPDPLFAQQIVTLRHPQAGEHAIFVTPIARDADGVTYEAVFN